MQVHDILAALLLDVHLPRPLAHAPVLDLALLRTRKHTFGVSQAFTFSPMKQRVYFFSEVSAMQIIPDSQFVSGRACFPPVMN